MLRILLLTMAIAFTGDENHQQIPDALAELRKANAK
jgi:hypothetical protein